MIEELKLLLPLLRDAGTGVFWLVALLFLKQAFVALLWPVAVTTCVVLLSKPIVRTLKYTEMLAQVSNRTLVLLQKHEYADIEGYVSMDAEMKLSRLLKENPFTKENT